VWLAIPDAAAVKGYLEGHMRKELVFSSSIAVYIASGTIIGLPAHSQQLSVSIGTGEANGLYYATGSAICRLVNKDSGQHGIRCEAQPTGGRFTT